MRARIARSGVDFWAALAAAAIATLLLIAATQMQAETLSVAHDFNGPDSRHPTTGLRMDRTGIFYGTTGGGSDSSGTVFKLTRKNSTWVYCSLHSFKWGDDGFDSEGPVVIGPDGSWVDSDPYDFHHPNPTGANPNNGMLLDAAGNLHGTTDDGGPG